MSRLTRDGTAEPVSRDQILRHARGQGDIIFPVQLTTSRIGNLTGLIHTLLYVMTIHTYIHTAIPGGSAISSRGQTSFFAMAVKEYFAFEKSCKWPKQRHFVDADIRPHFILRL